jgi:SlyX protein
MADLDARLADLEARLAFAEDMLDSLNLTVFRQQRQIDLLQAELRLLNDRLASLPGDDRPPPEAELPPHY